MQAATNPAALIEGSVFHGRYQIVRCIKAGGMGAVYECIHLTTRKRRALKVMLPQRHRQRRACASASSSRRG